MESISGIQSDRQPNQGERDEPDHGHRFVVKLPANEKLEGWAKELEKTEGGEADSSSCIAEENQRERGGNAGSCHQGTVSEAAAERLGDGRGVRDQPAGGKRSEQQGFCCESEPGWQWRTLFDYGIEGESERQHQSDPRHMAHAGDLDRHTSQSESDGGSLQPIVPFTEPDHAKQHVEKGIEVVSERPLQNAAIESCPNIQQPI